MASSWLFRPLPLRERVGRGVAPVSSTLRTRRLVVPSPPSPNPLPQGERESEVPSNKGVTAISTVLWLGRRPPTPASRRRGTLRSLSYRPACGDRRSGAAVGQRSHPPPVVCTPTRRWKPPRRRANHQAQRGFSC